MFDSLTVLFGVIVTGVLGFIATQSFKTRQHAKATKEQVTNHHETNLRDDVTSILTWVKSLDGRLAVVEQAQLDDRKTAAKNLEKLEKTIPPRTRKAPL